MTDNTRKGYKKRDGNLISSDTPTIGTIHTIFPDALKMEITLVARASAFPARTASNLSDPA